MERVTDRATLPLHDVTLEVLRLDWARGACVARLRGATLADGTPAQLRWEGVSAFQVERAEPWGSSTSILEARSYGPDGGITELAMQSGDIIRINAAVCYFEGLEAAV